MGACANQVGTGESVRGATDLDTRWLTVALTWNGLRTLGMNEASLATFPEEFARACPPGPRSSATRAPTTPTTGWAAWPARILHALVILFARDVAERERTVQEHQRFLAPYPGVQALSYLDLEALPPYDYHHDHFGYRDRLSRVVIEGSDEAPNPGSDPPLKPGEFFLGYPDEEITAPPLPQPEILSRNGSYIAYRQLQEHVGAFREFLRQNGETPEEQELLAAKLMGRWRSGAPLVLAPEHDDPELGADPERTNNFTYKEMYLWVCRSLAPTSGA